MMGIKARVFAPVAHLTLEELVSHRRARRYSA
jgi:hypothetical protein